MNWSSFVIGTLSFCFICRLFLMNLLLFLLLPLYCDFFLWGSLILWRFVCYWYIIICPYLSLTFGGFCLCFDFVITFTVSILLAVSLFLIRDLNYELEFICYWYINICLYMSYIFEDFVLVLILFLMFKFCCWCNYSLLEFLYQCCCSFPCLYLRCHVFVVIITVGIFAVIFVLIFVFIFNYILYTCDCHCFLRRSSLLLSLFVFLI